MFTLNTNLVNSEEHYTVPAGADPIVVPVTVTVDAGSIEIQVKGQTILVGMVNGDVTVAVGEGDKLAVYGKNRKWTERG